jgi:hypothetical protein
VEGIRRQRGNGKETRQRKLKEKERQGRKAWGQDEGKERSTLCVGERGTGNWKRKMRNRKKMQRWDRKRDRAGKGEAVDGDIDTGNNYLCMVLLIPVENCQRCY